MIHFIEKKMRYLLPSLFVGYAIVANASLFLGDETIFTAQDRLSVLEGSFTRELEQAYKTRLPHREPSIGLLGALRYRALGTGKPGIVVGANEWFFTKEEFNPAFREKDYISSAVSEISEIRDQLRNAGTELVIVPLPYKADIYSEFVVQSDSSRSAESQYYEFTKQLNDRNISVVDARSKLIQSKKEGPVFFKTDTHWTPLGANSVAQEVAASKLVQTTESSSFSIATSETKQFWGDLVSFVTDEKWGHIAGLEQELTKIWSAQEVEKTETLDLFGDDSTFPIILVGTSYSANLNWSFAEFLKNQLQADVLNMSEEGKGPATPMYSFLESDTFKENPPEVVIWEFPTRYLVQDTLWAQKPKESEQPTTTEHAVSTTPIKEDDDDLS